MIKVIVFLTMYFNVCGGNAWLSSFSTGIAGALYFLVDIQEPKQAKFPAFEL
jgi:hypothetical protein